MIVLRRFKESSPLTQRLPEVPQPGQEAHVNMQQACELEAQSSGVDVDDLGEEGYLAPDPEWEEDKGAEILVSLEACLGGRLGTMVGYELAED